MSKKSKKKKTTSAADPFVEARKKMTGRSRRTAKIILDALDYPTSEEYVAEEKIASRHISRINFSSARFVRCRFGKGARFFYASFVGV